MFKKIIDFTNNLMAKKTLPWVDEVDAMTDLAAIDFVTNKLNKDCNDGLFSDHQYLEAFLLLDEKAHVIVDRVSADYLNTDHIDLDYEAHIASVVFLYHRQINHVYSKLIQFPATALQAEILLTMLLRATNSITEMIKWRYYQFQSAPADIWLQLSKLYAISEEKLLQNESTSIYPQADEAVTTVDLKNKNQHLTTMMQAYIKACMLGTLETLSFKAPQIDLACKILNTWSSKLIIENEFNQDKHLFYVDLKLNAPAKRIRNLKINSRQRYWSLDSINSKIELCSSLLEFNIPAKQAKVIEITTSKQALNTLHVLRTEWCKLDLASQRRSAARINTAKSATISYGFDDACDHIKQADKSIARNKSKNNQKNHIIYELHENKATENTTADMSATNGNSNIVDESNKGIGLHIRKPANELSMGMLVAISAKDKAYDHKLAVIRNIKPVAGNQLHIGVELLSRTAFAAETENLSSQYENTATANNFGDTVMEFSQDFTRFASLFLPKEFSNIKEDSLILPMYQFRKTNTYRVNVSGKPITIKPTETLEQYENWVRITYKQL
jgi:hypothetical protein